VKWREDVWHWPTDGYVKMNSLPSFREHRFRCLQIWLAYFAIISDSLAWTWIWWKSWWNLKLTWLTEMIEDKGEEDGAASAIKCDDLPSKKYLCCFSWRPTGTSQLFLQSNLTLAPQNGVSHNLMIKTSVNNSKWANRSLRRGLGMILRQKKNYTYLLFNM
jgi:hypothetical protein